MHRGKPVRGHQNGKLDAMSLDNRLFRCACDRLSTSGNTSKGGVQPEKLRKAYGRTRPGTIRADPISKISREGDDGCRVEAKTLNIECKEIFLYRKETMKYTDTTIRENISSAKRFMALREAGVVLGV